LFPALEQDAGIDQLDACVGHAGCTTCRVEFIEGKSDRMTVVKRHVLVARLPRRPGLAPEFHLWPVVVVTSVDT
jgi:ferredoxin